ncbi:urease accessory protein [Modestobacter sp. I12A-02628]|uniref:Urease accessory protein UreF n=1 Tax=Goekera deserti TaxID=2497753 RepID=A0A7K3WJT5_9ACTN|nr:urease accessory UreF family protein [Goekera deserti]MPQ97734.1 urease accessory protein [Goekera deserti]NDI48379.1 urease accessory protein [Goekera deserti]NEL55980.1 urease accessory protein [Goekera deserti]
MSLTALLALADSRLPAGGHAHSGGVEQAISAGLVTDPVSLAGFLRRRVGTAGSVAAGLAAAACAVVGRAVGGGAVAAGAAVPPSVAAALADLDAEADARTPSPAQRAASRQQGRGLLRVGRRAWPHPAWDALPTQPHHAVALGVAAAAAGARPADAAAAAAYLSMSGPATAAQRLLALDPITVAAVTARLSPLVDEVAGAAARAAAGPFGGLDLLPASADPLLDLLAELHVSRKDRFFAS